MILFSYSMYSDSAMHALLNSKMSGALCLEGLEKPYEGEFFNSPNITEAESILIFPEYFVSCKELKTNL